MKNKSNKQEQPIEYTYVPKKQRVLDFLRSIPLYGLSVRARVICALLAGTCTAYLFGYTSVAAGIACGLGMMLCNNAVDSAMGESE